MWKLLCTAFMTVLLTASAAVSVNAGRDLVYLDEESVVTLLFGEESEAFAVLEYVLENSLLYTPRQELEATYGPYFNDVLEDARKNKQRDGYKTAQLIDDFTLDRLVAVAEIEQNLPVSGFSLQEYPMIGVTFNDYSTLSEEMRHQMQGLREPDLNHKYAVYVNRFLDGDYYGIHGDYLIATGKEREAKLAGLKAYVINEVTYGYIPTQREYEAIFNMLFNGYRALPGINDYVGEDFVYYIRMQRKEIRQTLAYLLSVEAQYIVRNETINYRTYA